jgi:hypothetical protein
MVSSETSNHSTTSLKVTSSLQPMFYSPSTTFDYPRCFDVATILCHSNCRADKTDLCLPEWVYEKIKEAGIGLVGG